MDGIHAKGVTVTYRNGHTALRDSSFNIPRGTVTALVGVNGAGKSTLFKAIMGFVPISRGEITLLGKPIREALKQNLVAYVPQAEEVDWAFPVLVEDVVMMGRYGQMNFMRIPRQADRMAVDKALERVGMTLFQDRRPGELSGGQQQRVALARALAPGPKLVLLDEPFSSLDAGLRAATREEVRKVLKETGTAALLVTHDPQDADAAGGPVIRLR